MGNRYCKKKESVNGTELNNSDVVIVLLAHSFVHACAVDQWQNSSRVSHRDVSLCLNKQPDWEGEETESILSD